jgi:hypothetical protein
VRSDAGVGGAVTSPPDAPASFDPSDPNALPGSSPDADGIVTDPGCPTGSHKCNGTCVSSSEADHCGTACVPCPGLTDGKAVCDGIKCGVECPAGKKPCISGCVDEAAACDGHCPGTQNPCNGICVDSTSVSACGTACVTCPVSPNGQTSCDGDKCVLACNDGYHACGGNSCASNKDPLTCGTGCSPCPIPTGGSATCDGTMCGAVCPAKMKLCKGACIDEGKACDGACPTGTHDCGGNCVSDKDTANCGTSCSPCQPPANSQASCDGAKCAFACRTGFHRCGDECKDNKSVNSCGTSSCTACPTSASATAACDGTKCDLKCNGTLHLCGDGTCKECCAANQCPAMANKTAACVNGSCQYTDNCMPNQTCKAETECQTFRTTCSGGVMQCTAMDKTARCGNNHGNCNGAGCQCDNGFSGTGCNVEDKCKTQNVPCGPGRCVNNGSCDCGGTGFHGTHCEARDCVVVNNDPSCGGASPPCLTYNRTCPNGAAGNSQCSPVNHNGTGCSAGGAAGTCQGNVCKPNCSPVSEDCENKKDDDCDGKIDCADSDCNNRGCGFRVGCMGGKCVPICGKAGLDCCSSECDPGLYCDPGRTCRTQLGTGQSCDAAIRDQCKPPGDCRQGAVCCTGSCNSDVCKPGDTCAVNGKACPQSGDCNNP